MESTRPIRALTRGLDALTVLNLRNGATVSEVAQEIRLPRTTVYRILETLRDAGCIFRDGSDDRYRLTVRVRALSEGFSDEAWVSRIAKPALEELGREIVWPASISTQLGMKMMVRETTDHCSVLAVERYVAGFRYGLPDSASGRVFLAFCQPEQRRTLLASLAPTSTELQTTLADIQRLGYSVVTRARRSQEDIALAVPILHEGALLAVIGIRVATAAMAASVAAEKYLTPMRRCAQKISDQWAQALS